MFTPRRIYVLATALAAVLALSAIALAHGGPGTPKPTGAKHKDGPYSKELNVGVHKPRNLYVKVKSTYDQPQDATITEQVAGHDEDYHVSWFKGKTDLSHDVQTSGYDFTLRPATPRLFRVRVKPLVDQPRKFCLYANPTVTVPSTGTFGPFFAINNNHACEA